MIRNRAEHFSLRIFLVPGTVQGGVQLQDYKSVGIRQFDDAHGLYLPHNTTIHITVVAINGAGLRTVSYSDPVVVDLTPPVFDYVNDGVEEGRWSSVLGTKITPCVF